MIIRQFHIPGIAHSSYLVAGSGACAVIDPARDTGRYREAAEELGVRITHILETHLHADFVSGHRDLADETGAEIFGPDAARFAFPHTALSEGDEVTLEDIRFLVLATAGHTPEHICYVGRPDLFPGRAEDLAGALYDNLHGKIMTLPDECELYPAHGMGSLCGRAMAAKRTSTIGYEKKYNDALKIERREEFVHALTSGMPAAPDHFARCSEINRAGPALVRELAGPAPVPPEQFARMQQEGAVVLDVRGYAGFAGMHVPGSWNIDLDGNFSTNAGWVIPPGRDILLVVDEPWQAEEAALQLRRVGFDRVPGFLAGGMFAWAYAALPVGAAPVVTPAEADALIRAGDAILLDVREDREWEESHVAGSVHVPWHDLRARHRGLDASRQYIAMCKGGQRAAIAAGILLMHSFPRVSILAGGYVAFRRAGYAP